MKNSILVLLFFLITSITAYSQINFLPYQSIPTGSWPQVICIGDVNNDGLNDVALGTAFYFDGANDYKVIIFLQNSTGGFLTPVKYSYPTSQNAINSIAVDDVNNDNLNDVIIGFETSIGIFYQNSSGTLNTIQILNSGNNVFGIKTGDLNSDGLTDIVSAHNFDNYIRVFYQNIGGGFTSVTYPKPQYTYEEIEVADVNNDGKDDVVLMAHLNNAGVHVFLQTIVGDFNNYISYSSSQGSPISLQGIAVGDLNNDNRNDVIASKGGNTPYAKLVFLFQDTITNLLETPLEFSTYDIPSQIEIADINCDGINEIVVAHEGWNKINIISQNDSGNYINDHLYFIPGSSSTPYGLCIDDINNDGLKDIAFADYHYGFVYLINKSVPTNFNQSDTIINHDIIYANIIHDTIAYNITTYDTFSNYYYSILQEYYVINIKYQDNIKIDTLIIKITDFCSNLYYDSVLTSINIFNDILISSDTILINTIKDSVNLISSVSIYPNPSNGSISIELPSPFDEYTKIYLYDELGRHIYEEKFEDKANYRKLNIPFLASGVYLLSIKSKSETITKPIIIIQ